MKKISVIPPLDIDLSIKRRDKSNRLKLKGINQRHQFLNPVGDKFEMPAVCENNHIGRAKTGKFKCNTATKEDVLEFRNQLYESSEKRDQFDYLSQFIRVTTPKNHFGKAEVARLMNIDYMIPLLDGNVACVCRTLFQAATGMNQRRLQNINKKVYKQQMIASGDLGCPEASDGSEKSKKLQKMIAAKKEEILSLKKGTLSDFSKIIEDQKNVSQQEEDFVEEAIPDQDIQEHVVEMEQDEEIIVPDEEIYEQILLDLDTLEICRVCCENKKDLLCLFTKIDSMDLFPADLIMFLFATSVEDSDELPSKICPSCLESLISACQLKKQWVESQKIMKDSMEDRWQYESSDSEIFMEYDVRLSVDSKKQPEVVEIEWNNESEIIYEECIEEEQDSGLTIGEVLAEEDQKFQDPAETSKETKSRKRYASKIKPAKCYLCDCDFETTAEDHFQTHHNVVSLKRCEKCTFETEFPWFLNLHYQLHSEEDFKLCTVCGRNIPRLSIYRHKRHCGVPKEPNSTKYPCRYCPQSYYSSYFRGVHERIHLNDKPYQCDQCDKKFHRNILLRQHMLSHGAEPEFQCYCGKGFVLNHRFLNHQSTCSVVKKYKIEIEKKK